MLWLEKKDGKAGRAWKTIRSYYGFPWIVLMSGVDVGVGLELELGSGQERTALHPWMSEMQ